MEKTMGQTRFFGMLRLSRTLRKANPQIMKSELGLCLTIYRLGYLEGWLDKGKTKYLTAPCVDLLYWEEAKNV